MNPRFFTLFALILSFTLQNSFAEKTKASDYTLNMVNWGEVITGDQGNKFDPTTLEGKVIIVEEFGVKTPACIERLKDLARLQKKLEKDKTNAVIIAIHRQRDVPDADLLKATEKARVNFPLRKNGFLPASIGGMPHAAIFLPDGTMFWHGDSTERDFEKALKEALESLNK